MKAAAGVSERKQKDRTSRNKTPLIGGRGGGKTHTGRWTVEVRVAAQGLEVVMVLLEEESFVCKLPQLHSESLKQN